MREELASKKQTYGRFWPTDRPESKALTDTKWRRYTRYEQGATITAIAREEGVSTTAVKEAVRRRHPTNGGGGAPQ